MPVAAMPPASRPQRTISADTSKYRTKSKAVALVKSTSMEKNLLATKEIVTEELVPDTDITGNVSSTDDTLEKAIQPGGLALAIKEDEVAAPAEELCYSVSYSEKSGATIRAMRDMLLESPLWQLSHDVHTLHHIQSFHRFSKTHLVIGGRDLIDPLIHDWRFGISRWGHAHRVQSKEEVNRLNMKSVVVFNYFSGKEELTLKSSMVRNLKNRLKKPWELTPLTFVLRPGSTVDGRGRFAADFKTFRFRGERLWIVKPARLNRAIGIRVMQDINAILQYVDSQEDAGEWVVQKYIERPFLLHGRKFDIRTWAVVDPRFNVWLWKEGVMRTASERYDPEDLTNHFCHLTNHCIQEKGPNYCKFEEQNLMRYDAFQAFLDEFHPGRDFRKEVVPRMKDIIFTCFECIRSLVTHSCCNDEYALLCYQVFGFDFLVDDTFQVWLLEINGQPWVAEDLRPAFTRDTIELIINPIFRPPGWIPGSHDFELVSSSATNFERRPSVERLSRKNSSAKGEGTTPRSL